VEDARSKARAVVGRDADAPRRDYSEGLVAHSNERRDH
jgi:hypothetical protein